MCHAKIFVACIGALIAVADVQASVFCQHDDHYRLKIDLDVEPKLILSHIAEPIIIENMNQKDGLILLEAYVLSENAIDENKRRATFCATEDGRQFIASDESAMPCGFSRMEKFKLNVTIEPDFKRVSLHTPDGFERSLFKNPEDFDVFKHYKKTINMACSGP